MAADGAGESYFIVVRDVNPDEDHPRWSGPESTSTWLRQHGLDEDIYIGRWNPDDGWLALAPAHVARVLGAAIKHLAHKQRYNALNLVDAGDELIALADEMREGEQIDCALHPWSFEGRSGWFLWDVDAVQAEAFMRIFVEDPELGRPERYDRTEFTPLLAWPETAAQDLDALDAPEFDGQIPLFRASLERWLTTVDHESDADDGLLAPMDLSGEEFFLVRDADASQPFFPREYPDDLEEDPLRDWLVLRAGDDVVADTPHPGYQWMIVAPKHVLFALGEAIRDLAHQRGGRRHDLTDFADYLTEDLPIMRDSEVPDWSVAVHPWSMEPAGFAELCFVPTSAADAVEHAIQTEPQLGEYERWSYVDRSPITGDYSTAIILTEALRASPIGAQLTPLRDSLERWMLASESAKEWPV